MKHCSKYSNRLQFTVTSLAPIGVRPSLTGASGPTSLAAGTQGTWTITLSAPTNTYVTLNVTWGDENLYGYAAQQAAQSIYATLRWYNNDRCTPTKEPAFCVGFFVCMQKAGECRL